MYGTAMPKSLAEAGHSVDSCPIYSSTKIQFQLYHLHLLQRASQIRANAKVWMNQ
jgi:hypothetical protein